MVVSLMREDCRKVLRRAHAPTGPGRLQRRTARFSASFGCEISGRRKADVDLNARSVHAYSIAAGAYCVGCSTTHFSEDASF